MYLYRIQSVQVIILFGMTYFEMKGSFFHVFFIHTNKIGIELNLETKYQIFRKGSFLPGEL